MGRGVLDTGTGRRSATAHLPRPERSAARQGDHQQQQLRVCQEHPCRTALHGGWQGDNLNTTTTITTTTTTTTITLLLPLLVLQHQQLLLLLLLIRMVVVVVVVVLLPS